MARGRRKKEPRSTVNNMTHPLAQGDGGPSAPIAGRPIPAARDVGGGPAPSCPDGASTPRPDVYVWPSRSPDCAAAPRIVAAYEVTEADGASNLLGAFVFVDDLHRVTASRPIEDGGATRLLCTCSRFHAAQSCAHRRTLEGLGLLPLRTGRGGDA